MKRFISDYEFETLVRNFVNKYTENQKDYMLRGEDFITKLHQTFVLSEYQYTRSLQTFPHYFPENEESYNL